MTSKGASPNYFGKENVFLTLGGGGMPVQAPDVMNKKMASGLPQPSTLGWGAGGVIMKRHNDVIFSKIVWRRP